jgi:hypothetical protein
MNMDNKWIMELQTSTGTGKRVWGAIHATGCPRYEFATRKEAQEILNMCYPETPREWLRVRQLEDGE